MLRPGPADATVAGAGWWRCWTDSRGAVEVMASVEAVRTVSRVLLRRSRIGRDMADDSADSLTPLTDPGPAL